MVSVPKSHAHDISSIHAILERSDETPYNPGMSDAALCPTDVDRLKRLLLDMAEQRSVDRALKLIVDQLAGQPDVALARVWLTAPGDICDACPMRRECPDQTSCLHLVASAGHSEVSGEAWTNLDGDFRRFPIGVRKVGKVAATARPIEVPDTTAETQWLARPDWARAEGIRGFGGQPLVHQGEGSRRACRILAKGLPG